jgi:hypothetical protein
MAQKVNIVLVDDLDGTEGAAETIAFGMDGDQFEIDLTEENAAKMRQAFAPYLAVARATQRRRGRKPAALAQAQAAAKTTSSRRGRKRTATVEDIEKSKQDANA